MSNPHQKHQTKPMKVFVGLGGNYPTLDQALTALCHKNTKFSPNVTFILSNGNHKVTTDIGSKKGSKYCNDVTIIAKEYLPFQGNFYGHLMGKNDAIIDKTFHQSGGNGP